MSAPGEGGALPNARPSGGGVGRWQLRLAALSALVLTFFAGLALGWGISRRSAWEGRVGRGPASERGGGPPRRGGGGGPGGPGGFGPLDRLNLTPPQRAAVDSIFAARRAQIDEFWRGDGQRLRHIIDSTSLDVRAVLDSAQRATFDSSREQRRRRDEERGHGGGGRRGGGGMPYPGGAPPR